jgi:hypothetical protein
MKRVSRQTRAGREVRRIVTLHLLHRIELKTGIAVLMMHNAGLGGQAWMLCSTRSALSQGYSVFHFFLLKIYPIITSDVFTTLEFLGLKKWHKWTSRARDLHV